MASSAGTGQTSTERTGARRMRRAERREQILDAATRAFARAGYAETSLDDVAAEAGISRVILYRHFESKGEMYRAVLERVCARLAETVGTGGYDENAIPTLVSAAASDPHGFRLLFRHAAREPEFREFADALGATASGVAHRELGDRVPDDRWAAWASRLLPTVVTEAVITWLDAGQPEPEWAAERISRAVHGVIDAASQPLGSGYPAPST